MKCTAVKSKNGGEFALGASSVRGSSPGEEDRLDHIAIAAYYKAETGGFARGQELGHWLEAEREFDERKGL